MGLKRRAAEIAAFCHIPKTGGMTFHDLLRRYFGSGHLITIPGRGWSYGASDLRRDMRLNPGLRSLGGHAMKPHVDFGDFEDRLAWYTILRDPIERSISNYQHQAEKRASRFSFREWLRRDCNQNWHVAMLAGNQDLSAAKQILREKIRCLGFIEDYNAFLLLLRDRMGWEGFNPTYRKGRNPPRTNDIRTRIKADLDRYMDDLLRANELDIALYEFARTEIYPGQVAAYGEDRLKRDLEAEFLNPHEETSEKIRRWRALLFEKGIYNPLMKVVRKVSA